MGSYASVATNEFAARPALYVKAEAVVQNTVGIPLTGEKVYFGDQSWYIVGMGDTGPVTGPENTITLFAASSLSDSDGITLAVETSTNYSESPLRTAMDSVGDTLGLWNFSLFDDNLSLTMTGASTQEGESLTFQYSGTQGENNRLAYVVEKTSLTGVSLYYGNTVSLSDSGSGTVTVPLGGSNGGSEDGDYTLRFYTESRSNNSTIIFASETVDLTIHVENGQVTITDLGDVTNAAAVAGVTIDPASWPLEAGQKQFTATVTSSDTNWYDQTVTWSVEGANSSGTTISDTGLLTVALDETASSLTVTATSASCTEAGVKDYYKCSVCGTAFEGANCTKEITDLADWTIPVLGHTWLDTYLAENADESRHYHVCTVCGEKDEGEEHVYDDDVDTTYNVCGYERQLAAEYTVTFDASGNVALQFTHASEYAIVLDEKSHDLPFTDVGGSDWFMTAVQYVYQNGIMGGTSATTFEPNTTLSRAMVAQMLYNYAQYKEIILPALGDLSKFPDGNKVSDWAQTAMSWATGLKVINGYEDNTLRPAGSTTRGEAASMIMGLATTLV